MQNEKQVCSNCIDNFSLKRLIEINGNQNCCSYCTELESKRITMPVKSFVKEITKRIETRYLKANIYADKDEDDYYSKIIETKEIIDNDIKPTSNLLSNDLYNLIGGFYWADKYSYIVSPDEQMGLNWEMFCKKIKEELSEEERDKILYETLAPICQYIVDEGIIDIIDVGTWFYRARAKALDDESITHEELGPPPEEYTKSNRFTKAGESAFYGSTDDITPILEVCNESDPATVGIFETTVTLVVIDFYKIANELKQERTIFEDNYYIKEFLDYFIVKISAPADEKYPENYLSTQEMISFFRKELKKRYGIQINGFKYPSSKTVRNTANCILFFNKDDCTDDKKNEDKPLKLLKTETLIYPPGYWPIKDKDKYHIEVNFGSVK